MSEQASRRSFLKTSALGLGAGAAIAGAAGCSRSATTAAAGSSKLNEVLKRGTVIVGTGSTNPPWHFEDEKGDLQGFDIEMARLLAKGLFDDPSKVQFVRQASDARVPNLQTGQVDVVFQFMTVTAQRAQLVDFSIPYYREGVGTLLRRTSAYAGALDLAKTGVEFDAYAAGFERFFGVKLAPPPVGFPVEFGVRH
jgi:polar amino acid transport system substrate-binding protein